MHATTAPQTAQLNVLAEGLQQVNLIAQNAQTAVANALAAPLHDTAQSTSGSALPSAPAPAVADMYMDHDAYNDHLGNPVNPRLPPTLARKTTVCGYFKCKHCSKHIRPLPRSKAFGW